MHELPDRDRLAERLETFTNIPPQGGVNNFLLEGPLKREGMQNT